jgi:molybdopterin-guanine dinucleotide biosynthesis protein A
VLVVAVDLPHLTLPYLEKMLRAGCGRTGVVPRGPHGYEPLVALYPRTLLTTVEAALRAGQLSLQRLIQDETAKTHLVPLEIGEAEAPLFTNWNTPHDVQT